MNKTLLAKIGWRLLNDRKSLWARVLRSKYKVGSVHDNTWLKKKGTWSPTWKSVCIGLKDGVLPGLSWVIGNGQKVKFWSDKWLGNEPLLQGANRELAEEETQRTVGELWVNGAGWDMSRINPYVSDEVKLRLVSVVIDDVTGARDRISWGETPDGKFTVSSAYALLTRNKEPRLMMTNLWKRVWKVLVPERVRVFIWLIVHQVIMTNMERHRRHLCESAICQVCSGGEETIMHVVRDCESIAGIWRRIVPSAHQATFFGQSLLDWIYGNLTKTVEINGISWATLFGMTVWWGWKWRCGEIFGENRRCNDRVKFVKELAAEVLKASKDTKGLTKQVQRVEKLIAWTKPATGWFKVNTDGASRGNPGLASAGGAVRDEDGNWCIGFAVNVGSCTAPLAELWGVYYGLYVAWERGIRQIEIEIDSEMVVGFLKTGISSAHPLSFLVRLCYGFFAKDWIVRVTHVHREANRLADGLANYAFSRPLGFHLFDVVPDCVSEFYVDDLNGRLFPRNIVI